MTLNLIGIGLHDEQDITLKGLELVKKSDQVYLENYTSQLAVPKEKLEARCGKPIVLANRKKIEQDPEIIEQAKTRTVSVLIIGDIFGATTHYDLYLRAKKQNIPINLVHNASVLAAVSVTGLMLYHFGKTTSIPFRQKGFEPETAYEVLKQNQEHGLHTLMLLDLLPEENRFMTVQEAIQILLKIEKKRKEQTFTENTRILGCARLGGDFNLKYGSARELLGHDFGKPLHSLIVPGKLHFLEEEALEQWK